nr:polysaccharide biosynthesis C-terminal domain-containing protein [Calditrichia bacterium]
MKIRQTRRLRLVFFELLNTFSGPAINILLSLSVVRLASETLWGEFVAILLWLNLGLHLCGWGQRDYLIRAFARQPAGMGAIWRNNLASRLPLILALAGIIILTPLPFNQRALLIAWSLASLTAEAFAAPVLYYQRFRLTLLLETGGALLALGWLWLPGTVPGLDRLLQAMVLSNSFRALGLLLVFRGLWRPWRWGSFQGAHLREALPFLLIGFTGLLQSRTDLYCVAVFCDSRDLAQYQVFVNRLIDLQILANLIVRPFVKYLYRLPGPTLRRLAIRQFFLAPLLFLPGLGLIYGLMHFWYGFDITPNMYLFGGFFVWPVYAYIFGVYRLNALNRQSRVVFISGIAILVNLALNLLWIGPFGPTGALAASAVSQLIPGVFYGTVLWS